MFLSSTCCDCVVLYFLCKGTTSLFQSNREVTSNSYDLSFYLIFLCFFMFLSSTGCDCVCFLFFV